MKAIKAGYLSIFFLICSVIQSEKNKHCDTIFAQNDTSVVCTTMYAHGKIKAIRHFHNGKKHGLNQIWFENGSVKSIAFYNNGCYTDTSKVFYPNGSIRSLIPYLDCKIHGVARVYDSNGSLTSEEPYAFGQYCGTQRYWYSNGQLRKVQEIDSTGEFHGITGEYFENGKISWETTYIHGKRVISKSFYENFLLEYEQTYEDDGKRIKNGKYYYSDGKIAGEIKDGNGSYVKCVSGIGCKKYIYKNGTETGVEDFIKDN